jgi:hypothetical protein
MSLLKRYWPIVAMLLLTILTWSAVVYDIYDRHHPRLKLSPVSGAALLTGWGITGTPGASWPIPGLTPQVYMVINGRLLSSFEQTHHVAGVAFHQFGISDPDNVRDLQKSELHDIRDEDIRIDAILNASFMDEFSRGARGTTYKALLIPNGIRMEDFQTLHEAYRMGVVEIGHGGGPP